MKLKNLFLLLVLAVVTACSDDDPAPNDLENIELSFKGETEVITLPQGLINSSNPYAQTAYTYASSTNLVSAYFAFMNFPGNAEKTTNRIIPSNARVSNTGSYLIYTWSDSQFGSIAYQLGDLEDSYSFEVFFKELGEDAWTRYFYAEEKKDQTSGFMYVYDILGEDPSSVIAEYEWTRSNNTLIFNYKFFEGTDLYTSIVITVNETTGAGKIEYFTDDILNTRISWDAAGNGEWEEFDEEGNLTDEGTWSAGS